VEASTQTGQERNPWKIIFHFTEEAKELVPQE
jgi:hypothetical protein